jgi:hypothetical protein
MENPQINPQINLQIDPRLDEDYEIKEEDVDSNEQVEDIPTMTSPEWDGYVLSHFAPDELSDGHPTVGGLRRVAEYLLGEIISSISDVVQPPVSPDLRATVIHTITFESGKRFSGAADSYYGNTDKPYGLFPTSIAETRAEARALRRALKLKNIVSADELAKDLDDKSKKKIDKSNESNEPVEPINDTQVNCVNVLCGRNNINVQKTVQKHFGGIKNIKELTREQATNLVQILSGLQQDRTKITDDVAGFNVDWKANFA